MKRLLLSLTIYLIAGASLALAQTPVIVNPSKFSNANASGSIVATNTFQSIWPSNSNRNDCVIQNNGAASMYVYFGPIASATTPNSLVLASAGIFRCGNSGVVSKDQISITGTISQSFFAIQY